MSNAATPYDQLLIACIKLGNMMSGWIIRGDKSKPPQGADPHEVTQLMVMLDALRADGVFSGFRITRGLYNGQLDAAVDRYLRDDNDFEEALFDREADSHTTYETQWGERPLTTAGGPMSAFVSAFFTLYKRDFIQRIRKEVVISPYDLSKQKLVPKQTEFDLVALQLFEELYQGVNLLQRPPAALQYGLDLVRLWGVLMKECLTSQRISLLQQRPLFDSVWDAFSKKGGDAASQQRSFFGEVLEFKSRDAKLNRFYGWPDQQKFSNLDFSYATFQAHLNGSVFNNCNLDNIKLKYPPISSSTSGSLDDKREGRILNCQFNDCSLIGLILSPLFFEEHGYSTPGGSLTRSSFEGCSIGLWGRVINMVETSFIGCDFPEEGRGIELEHSRIDQCSFIDCKFSKMALHKCGVVDTTFSLVSIHSLRLTDSTLVQCTFENVTFSSHIFFLQPQRSYLINSLWDGEPATPDAVNNSSEADLLNDIDGNLAAPFTIITNIISENDEIGASEDSGRETGGFAVPVLFQDVHKVYEAPKEEAVDALLNVALTGPFYHDGIVKGTRRGSSTMAHPDTKVSDSWSASDANIMARSLWFWLAEDNGAPGARAYIDSDSYYQNTLSAAVKSMYDGYEVDPVYTVHMEEGKDLLVGYHGGYDEGVMRYLIFGNEEWGAGPHEDEQSLIYLEEDLVTLFECDSSKALELVEHLRYGEPAIIYGDFFLECWGLDYDVGATIAFQARVKEIESIVKGLDEQATEQIERAKEEVEMVPATQTLSSIVSRLDANGDPLYHLLEVGDGFDRHDERYYILNPKAFYIVDVE
tara:strand:+ start:5378 stop:7813 length:2436 start_codon:yes stop_codon:yes gene_type:complete